jgi:hypothetical protein
VNPLKLSQNPPSTNAIHGLEDPTLLKDSPDDVGNARILSMSRALAI